MDVLKEYEKFHGISQYDPTLESARSKVKSQPLAVSLDSLITKLHAVKAELETGTASTDVAKKVKTIVEQEKKEVDERLKEIHTSLNRVGKALDKKFANTPTDSPPLFQSREAVTALERTIAMHYIRTGAFPIAQVFLQESGITIPEDTLEHSKELHRIVAALRAQDIRPALIWAEANRSFLDSRASPLEFYLHRSQFMRLLLASNPPNPLPAIAYAKSLFRPFHHTHSREISRLMTTIVYLPLGRLQKSPYADLASPSIHFMLEPLFAKEFCASLGMSRQLPLRVVGDIGGGGALGRIEKAKKVMRERRSEWSQSDELPIEIPLLPENRYHSIFTCPVSKEQGTEANPPMMMSCGHVVAKESLNKFSRTGGRVKCPYCPTESYPNSALRVYF